MDENKKVAIDGTMTTSEFGGYVHEQHSVTLINGTAVKLNFSVETENYNHEDLHELLSYLAMCSHNFYLITGKHYETLEKET